MKQMLMIFTAMLMSLCTLADTVPATYLYPVYNEEGEPKSGIKEWKTGIVDAIPVTSPAQKSWGTSNTTNWYVLANSVEGQDSITCKGHVRLILCKGAKLTMDKLGWWEDKSAIEPDPDGTFEIYGQPDGAGELEVTGGKYCAGIGGFHFGWGTHITINGGTIRATGGLGGAGIGGGAVGAGVDITINGGVVIANGGYIGAGIGGGSSGHCSSVTINGGSVTATGGTGAAGIGGGYDANCYNILINDGQVTATGGSATPPDVDGGAGIGGGHKKNGRDITIRGGFVTATGGMGAAGVGGGCNGNGYDIAVSGGRIVATGGSLPYVVGGGAGIGGGNTGSGHDITIVGGTVSATGGPTVEGIGSGKDGTAAAALTFVGGNVTATVGCVPTNVFGQAVYKVTKESCLSEGPVVVNGLGDYGVNDLYPVSQCLCFWLPDGYHAFWMDDVRYDMKVAGRATNAMASVAFDSGKTYDFETLENAMDEARHLYVMRPNEQVEAVVSAERYDGLFEVEPIPSSVFSRWTIDCSFAESTTNAVQTAFSTAERDLVLCITTNDSPVVKVQTLAGLYYGIASVNNVTEIRSAVPQTWTLGTGARIDVYGYKPTGAKDRAFYQLRVNVNPISLQTP